MRRMSYVPAYGANLRERARRPKKQQLQVSCRILVASFIRVKSFPPSSCYLARERSKERGQRPRSSNTSLGSLRGKESKQPRSSSPHEAPSRTCLWGMFKWIPKTWLDDWEADSTCFSVLDSHSTFACLCGSRPHVVGGPSNFP